MKLSVIILTFNEETHIEKAIESVLFCEEIIVIDSFSTDNTVELVKKYPVKLYQNKFKNYADQRNFAINKSTGKWILFLDADERVSLDLKNEILLKINDTASNLMAYKIWFPHFFMNRYLFHYTDKVIRLIKSENFIFKNEVHEKAVVNGGVGLLKNYMIHDTYKGFHHYVNKKVKYASFQAKMSFEKNKKETLFLLFFKPFYRFFHTYFVKRVYLDGIPGFASASIDAYGVFLRYAKLLVLNEKKIKKV